MNLFIGLFYLMSLMLATRSQAQATSAQAAPQHEKTLVVLAVPNAARQDELELKPVIDTLCAELSSHPNHYDQVLRSTLSVDFEALVQRLRPDEAQARAANFFRNVQGQSDAATLQACDGQVAPGDVFDSPLELLLIQVTSPSGENRNVSITHVRWAAGTLTRFSEPMNVHVQITAIENLGRCLAQHYWKVPSTTEAECKKLGFPVTQAIAAPDAVEPPLAASASPSPARDVPSPSWLLGARADIALDAQPGISGGVIVAYSRPFLADAWRWRLQAVAQFAAHSQLLGPGIGLQWSFARALALGALFEFSGAHLDHDHRWLPALHPSIEVHLQPFNNCFDVWLSVGHYWFIQDGPDLDRRFYTAGVGVGFWL